jgi:hypothetical protein
MLKRIKDFFSSKSQDDVEVEMSQTKQQDTKQQKTNSTNRNEIVSSVFSSCIDLVKIAMATLLSIFVPQYCEETGTTCTLQDNFSNLSKFNEFVIGWNFFTLGLFFTLTYVINKRESYFISHLDASKDHAFNSLTINCKDYPKILARVKDHNNKLHFWVWFTTVSFIFNVLVSCILVFYFFYDGFRSITTLVANVLLVSSKLYMLIVTCHQCRQAKMLALSTISFIPTSFNVIDKDYDKTANTPGVYYPMMTLTIDKI